MSTHSVSIRNRDGRVVSVSEDEFILDALEDAGMRVPFGCRFGACLTCAASLVEGRVVQSGGRSFALRPHQEDDGYVLLCVASPRSDCVIEVGTRRDLYVNPFKHRAAGKAATS
ncbi:MAG: 2Fe-2S iron-sulfur cluster-binding protein [Pseudonocardia sp.]|nr:2Fe-2S iron-sulfur cluster-binding protein [Pseudonocardia sp.]